MIITHANVVSTVAGIHTFLKLIKEDVTEEDCVRVFIQACTHTQLYVACTVPVVSDKGTHFRHGVGGGGLVCGGAHCLLAGRLLLVLMNKHKQTIRCTQNNVKLLLHDARASRPTLFAAVPRVLERVVSETKGTLATKPAFIQRIFAWAVAKKIKRMYRTGQVKTVRVST